MPSPIALVLFVLFLYPALLLAVIVHEAGHALFARWIGDRVTSLGLGTGRPFFRKTMRNGAIFFLCRDNPTLGTCWTTTSELLPSRSRRALLLVGGGITNLVVGLSCIALLNFAFWRTPFTAVGLAVAAMNTLLGIANLCPFRQRVAGSRQTVASDGLQAISLFMTRHARAEPPYAELGFQGLWEAIGDIRTLRYRLALAAIAACRLKLDAAAYHWLHAAEALPADETEVHLSYIRGILGLHVGEPENGVILLQKARQEYTDRDAVGSVLLCNLSLLPFLSPTNIVATEKAINDSRLAHRADMRTTIAAMRVHRFVRNEEAHRDVATLETLLAQYEAARRHYRSDIQEAHLYSDIALWREKGGDRVGAQVAWERVRTATYEIERSLSADPVLRDAYRRSIDDLSARLGFPSLFTTNTV